jgi:hypothetical protein
MMRMHAVLSTGLAALLVLPRLRGGGDDPAVLEASLTRTVHALEVLSGIDQRLRAQDLAVVGDVLSVTEPAGGDPAAASATLETLRREVSLLQMELDQLEAAPAVVLAPVAKREPPAVTTGLDDATRKALQLPIGAGDGASADGALASAPPATVANEGPGYSADPLRHALACLRARRPERALELLTGREDPESQYWRARALADLDRIDEAIAILARLSAASGDDFTTKRATTDLEFLRWKRDFVSRLPAGLRARTEDPR